MSDLQLLACLYLSCVRTLPQRLAVFGNVVFTYLRGPLFPLPLLPLSLLLLVDVVKVHGLV